LATTRARATEPSARIAVDSAPNQGTTFRIDWPEAAINPHRADLPDEIAPLAPSGGGKVVLLLDDRPDIVALVSSILTNHGYHVLQADSAQRALEIAANREEPIDLLLTDVIMPGLDGTEVSRRLTSQRPGLQTLFMTAYSDDMLSSLGIEAGPVDVVLKPFQPHEILARVAAALARARN
jgi:CheY-like chemotaxis protein